MTETRSCPACDGAGLRHDGAPCTFCGGDGGPFDRVTVAAILLLTIFAGVTFWTIEPLTAWLVALLR